MLWKYKKCYTEANEDVLPPTCIKLVRIISEDPSGGEIFYQYKDCDSLGTVTDSFIDDTGIINICIVEGSLFIFGSESVTVTTEPNCNASCYSVTFITTGPAPIAFGRVSCNIPVGGESPTITVPGNSQIELCVQSHTPPTANPTQWDILLGGDGCSTSGS